jgi:hypothetical protein
LQHNHGRDFRYGVFWNLDPNVRLGSTNISLKPEMKAQIRLYLQSTCLMKDVMNLLLTNRSCQRQAHVLNLAVQRADFVGRHARFWSYAGNWVTE